MCDNEKMVELLLKRHEVDVNNQNGFMQTPLGYAVIRGHVAIVKSLVALKKVDVNIKDRGGELLYSLQSDVTTWILSSCYWAGRISD